MMTCATGIFSVGVSGVFQFLQRHCDCLHTQQFCAARCRVCRDGVGLGTHSFALDGQTRAVMLLGWEPLQLRWMDKPLLRTVSDMCRLRNHEIGCLALGPFQEPQVES